MVHLKKDISVDTEKDIRSIEVAAFERARLLVGQGGVIAAVYNPNANRIELQMSASVTQADLSNVRQTLTDKGLNVQLLSGEQVEIQGVTIVTQNRELDGKSDSDFPVGAIVAIAVGGTMLVAILIGAVLKTRTGPSDPVGSFGFLNF